MFSMVVGQEQRLVGADVAPPRARPDEAVVRVEASSVNRGELALVARRAPGWRPGQDVAGIVVTAAADGTGPAVGTRVAGLAEEGAWSEQVAVTARRLAPVPDGVDPVDAAALPMAGLTALRTTRLAGSLLGRRVLVTGATGGVGRLQVQLARDAGADVVALGRDRRPDGPVDVVLDGTGGPVLQAAIGALRPGGTVVWFGGASGEPAPLTIYDFVGHENARILTYFSYAADPDDDAADLAVLLDRVATGRLDAGVAVRFALDEAAAALDRLAAGGVGGKVGLS